MARGKTDQSKSKKNNNVESDNEDDKYKNNYDATAQNNQGDDDDLLLDVDIDGDWDDGDEVDVDADADADADGDIEDVDVEGVGNIEDTVADNNDDDDCAYNGTRKSGGIKKVSANIDRDDDDDDDDESNINENGVNPDVYTKPENRKSPPILTQFERVRIIGDRTAQLAQGAKPMINGVDGMDPRVVSQLELESKMIPIKICRPMPNGEKEVWKLSELRLKKKYIVYGFTGGVVDKELVNQIDNEYKKGGSIVGYSQLATKYNSKKNQK